MPGEIRIRRRALTVLQQLLRAALPWEGCALLLGDRVSPAEPPRARSVSPPAGGDTGAEARSSGTDSVAAVWQIGLIWPCLNVWEPTHERPRHFQLDPREQLLAQRWGRERGLRVLGSAHSHPCSAALPSATDLEMAVAPTLLLILSPLEDWSPACWWLDVAADGPPASRLLPWRMVD